ncbi:hypothetical protein FQZ97_157680 [compost metagenome]
MVFCSSTFDVSSCDGESSLEQDENRSATRLDNKTIFFIMFGFKEVCLLERKGIIF